MIDELPPTEDIHVSQARVKITPGSTVWYEGKAFKSFTALVSILRHAATVAVIVGGIYLYQQKVNAQVEFSQADMVREQKSLRDDLSEEKRDVMDLRKTTVPADVFKSRMDSVDQRLARIEASIDRLALRQ